MFETSSSDTYIVKQTAEGIDNAHHQKIVKTLRIIPYKQKKIRDI